MTILHEVNMTHLLLNRKIESTRVYVNIANLTLVILPTERSKRAT